MLLLRSAEPYAWKAFYWVWILAILYLEYKIVRKQKAPEHGGGAVQAGQTTS